MGALPWWVKIGAKIVLSRNRYCNLNKNRGRVGYIVQQM